MGGLGGVGGIGASAGWGGPGSEGVGYGQAGAGLGGFGYGGTGYGNTGGFGLGSAAGAMGAAGVGGLGYGGAEGIGTGGLGDTGGYAGFGGIYGQTLYMVGAEGQFYLNNITLGGAVSYGDTSDGYDYTAWDGRINGSYFVTPNFAVNLSQRFIINPTKEINFEPWGIAGLNRGRSETGIRFSYQF